MGDIAFADRRPSPVFRLRIRPSMHLGVPPEPAAAAPGRSAATVDRRGGDLARAAVGGETALVARRRPRRGEVA